MNHEELGVHRAWLAVRSVINTASEARDESVLLVGSGLQFRARLFSVEKTGLTKGSSLSRAKKGCRKSLVQSPMCIMLSRAGFARVVLGRDTEPAIVAPRTANRSALGGTVGHICGPARHFGG